MQVRRRILDVVMLVLAGTAFRSEYATAVDILEISIGKLMVSLGILGLLAVNSQIPFAVFGKAVEADVFAFLHGGRLVLAPCISLVDTNRPSSISSLARSYARWLSVTVMNVLLFRSLRIRV
jgi:hypothetical protein